MSVIVCLIRAVPGLLDLARKEFVGRAAIVNAARDCGIVTAVAFGGRGEIILTVEMPDGSGGLYDATSVAFP